MAIRYLRRPPKPAARKIKGKTDPAALPQSEMAAGTSDVEVLPTERVKMAQALAYFCAACGREHMPGGVCSDDVCSAETKITEVIKHPHPS